MPRIVIILVLALAAAACGDRRDTADVGASLAPFAELRGMNVAELRVGQIRALRRGVEPAPLEGLREPIGVYDVLFEVPGFDGTDGSWPREDVQVLAIEATREWPSDSSALAAWESSVTEIRNATGATPNCLALNGPGFALRVVEFDRGGDWRLATAVAPETTLTNRERLSARHSLAVRRGSLTERYPEEGAENPDELPTWTRDNCPGE